MNEWLLGGDYGTEPTNVPMVVLGLILAFLGGHLIAWVYMLTHTGLSYSRSFVNSLIVIPLLVSMVMQVLANNLVTAFGMMAVFAIVRFRNILRDTLDTAYILAVIVIGMAFGTMKFTTGIVGCLLLVAIMIYLWTTEFGTRHHYDVIVNLHWARAQSEIQELQRLLERHSRRAQCASQRTHGTDGGVDLSYRMRLRDPNRMEDLLTELRELPGVSRVSGLKAEEQSEL